MSMSNMYGISLQISCILFLSPLIFLQEPKHALKLRAGTSQLLPGQAGRLFDPSPSNPFILSPLDLFQRTVERLPSIFNRAQGFRMVQLLNAERESEMRHSASDRFGGGMLSSTNAMAEKSKRNTQLAPVSLLNGISMVGLGAENNSQAAHAFLNFFLGTTNKVEQWQIMAALNCVKYYQKAPAPKDALSEAAAGGALCSNTSATAQQAECLRGKIVLTPIPSTESVLTSVNMQLFEYFERSEGLPTRQTRQRLWFTEIHKAEIFEPAGTGLKPNEGAKVALCEGSVTASTGSALRRDGCVIAEEGAAVAEMVLEKQWSHFEDLVIELDSVKFIKDFVAGRLRRAVFGEVKKEASSVPVSGASSGVGSHHMTDELFGAEEWQREDFGRGFQPNYLDETVYDDFDDGFMYDPAARRRSDMYHASHDLGHESCSGWNMRPDDETYGMHGSSSDGFKNKVAEVLCSA